MSRTGFARPRQFFEFPRAISHVMHRQCILPIPSATETLPEVPIRENIPLEADLRICLINLIRRDGNSMSIQSKVTELTMRGTDVSNYPPNPDKSHDRNGVFHAFPQVQSSSFVLHRTWLFRQPDEFWPGGLGSLPDSDLTDFSDGSPACTRF